jgi:malate synthase
MGGMAAQIPIKSDPERNRLALEKVREDKRREARDGHDGTWVAHPGLVGIATAEFDAVMPGFNQIHRLRQDVKVTAADLLRVPSGSITESGLRQNINVGIRYLEAWLRGSGCVPINDLMEDAATAEISRTQLWQWIKHGACLSDGRTIDRPLFAHVLESELDAIRAAIGKHSDAWTFDAAVALFRDLVESERLEDFLTHRAYDFVTSFTWKQENIL